MERQGEAAGKMKRQKQKDLGSVQGVILTVFHCKVVFPILKMTGRRGQGKRKEGGWHGGRNDIGGNRDGQQVATQGSEGRSVGKGR